MRSRRWPPRPTQSLVLKLTILVASVVVLLVAALLLCGAFFWREILREQIHARLSAVAESRSDFVREWVARQQDRAEVYASRGVIRGWLERRIDQRRDDLQRFQSQGNLDRHVQSGAALVAAIADPQGRVLLSSDPADVGRDFSQDAAFIAGLKAPSIGLPQRDGDRFIVLAAVPVRRLEGSHEPVGVVLLTLEATPLANALRATTGLGTTGEVVLAVRDGDRARYLLAPRYLVDRRTVPLAAVPAMAAAIEGRPFIGVTRDYRGEHVLAAARPIGYGGWSLVAKMDASEAYAPIARAGRYGATLGAIVGLAGLVAAFLLARGVTRPIRELVSAAERVASGDYAAVVPANRQDELGILAARFNEMTTAIGTQKAERDAREAALHESQQWLRLAQKAAHAGTWEWNLRTNTNIWSDELWLLYGLPPNSCEPTFSAWLQTVVPEDREQAARSVEVAAAAGVELTAEWRVRDRDGGERWLFSRGQPQRDAEGQVYRYIGIVVDITARKQAEAALRELNEQLEARVADRTAKLRETVAELERFSYSISHDMRAPLRAMEGYATAVLEDYGGKLGPDAKGYLERIVAAATRQDRLITDVLSYSRVVRSQVNIEPVDLDQLVSDLFHQYPNLRENAAAISVDGPLGWVLGHDVLLTQCLTNLLSNGLKFVPPGRKPRVRLRTERDDGVVRLWVEDNGIGIAPEYHERIFGMLERIHAQREYEGTGIGLAIVRRAADRMEGKVGVISAAGAGSRFWLELRCAPHDARCEAARPDTLAVTAAHAS